LGGELLYFPYDGANIGDFLGDASRDIFGSFFIRSCAGDYLLGNLTGAFKETKGMTAAGVVYTTGNSPQGSNILFNASNCVPTAYENRGASLSEARYIQY